MNKTKVFYFAILFFSTTIMGVDETKWEKTGETNGILTFQRNDGSELLQVKGTVIINRGIDTMGNILRDIKNHVRWVNYCDEAKVLKVIDRNHYIFYETMSPPWPVNKRDMVLQSKSEYFNDKLMVTIKSKAIDYKDFPVRDDTVRIKILEVKLNLEYITRYKTGLVYEIKVDPSGDIPSFISNIFNQMYVYENLDNLRLTSMDDNYIKTLTDENDKILVDKLVRKNSVLKKTFQTRLERLLPRNDNLSFIVNDPQIFNDWLENKDGFAEGLFWAAHDNLKKEENLRKLMSLYLKRFKLTREEIAFLSTTNQIRKVFLQNNIKEDLNIEYIKNVLTGKG